MEAARWGRVREVFAAALERPLSERSAAVDELCGGDPELERQVRTLLRAHSDTTAFLEEPAAAEPFGETASELEAGDRLGPWRIAGVLGEGGMGVVYRAARADGAFDREVAIKRIRGIAASGALLQRFDGERRILAALDHPGIARLLDAGTSPDGSPYLVLELVDGEPIDGWCAARALPLRERLRLMVDVCDAVAFAHQRLVLHRDLKPSNILVDGAGHPKLLDFGIAKLLDPATGGERAATLTALGQRAFTPEYASPEQVAGEALDTASDVWSLGVVLFRLLTGRSPYGAGTLARAADATERATIAPPSASTVLRGAPDGDASAAAAWPIRARELRGDLDVILGRALEPDRARRYRTAAELQDDLRRYLDGRPVLARADALGYRVGKFVRRHRIGVSATVAGALALAAGAGVAMWQAHRARRERDAADRARQRSDGLVDFMLGDLQQKLEPSHRLDVVADLARAVAESLDAIPDAERTSVAIAQRARVLVQLADTLQLQGHPQRAAAELRRAIELLTTLAAESAAPPEIAIRLGLARTLLARNLADGGDPRGAAEEARAAVRDWRSLLEARPDDPEARVGLADALNEAGRLSLISRNAREVLQCHLEAIALLESVPPAVLARREVARLLYHAHQYAGRGHEFAGELEAAIDQYTVGIDQASAYAAANPDDVLARHQITTVTNDLGRTLRKMGRLTDATAVMERALAITQEVVERDPGNNHFLSDLAACRAYLGRTHEMAGDLQIALDEFRAEVAIKERLVAIDPENGSWSSYLAFGLTSEGRALMGLGRPEEAAARHQRALALRERALAESGEDATAQADVAESLLELGRVEAREGRAEASLSAWLRARALLEAALRTSDYAVHRVRLARTLLELGDTERARPVVERLLRERCNEPELLALCELRGIGTSATSVPQA
jgi:non-specific serine/threonine protein kinase/serine/threonine-protein kinase